MDDLIATFFNKTYENELNEKLQELNYKMPTSDVLSYCKRLIDLKIDCFFSWLDEHSFFTIDSTDMPQLSDFDDAFYNVVSVLKEAGDAGYRYIEIGKMLQNDSIERNDMANRKYGENHAKAAEYLGYLYSLHYHYYVSCLGYVIDNLNEEEKNKLFTRLLMRTNLFKSIYTTTKNGSLDFKSLFDVLSYKTYKRRLPGTRMILNSLNNSKEFDFSSILSKICY